MAKFGDRFVEDLIDRGRRELGAVFYHDSNVAQPMYPLRGGYEVPKDAGGINDPGRSLAERLEQPAAARDGPDREDPERDRGIERE